MKLTKDQIVHYQQDGFIIVENILSKADLERLRIRTHQIASGEINFPQEQIEFEPGAKGNERTLECIRKINRAANIDPVFASHARNSVILDIVECLLGPNIKLFGDQFFIKPPGGIEKTYHQDSPYFKIEPMALVTAWTALDDVTIENGCLRVIPGSHNEGPRDHSEAWMVRGRQDMKIPDRAIDLSKERSITLKSGSCSFHHSLLLHRSGPNKTQDFRRGYATHYMNACSRWTGSSEEKPNYPLLRGKEMEGCV